MFLFRLSDVQISQIESKIKELPDVVRQRRMCLDQYREKLGCPEHVTLFPYEEGAVPWRFNIFVDKNLRGSLIEVLLAKHLPVSDWYPSVAPIFGNTETFPNTEYFSDRILNFPIPLTEKEINDICSAIKVFCASHA
jgi:dTDP-4-amino-4,6-dideoxygalactose transaminase